MGPDIQGARRKPIVAASAAISKSIAPGLKVAVATLVPTPAPVAAC